MEQRHAPVSLLVWPSKEEGAPVSRGLKGLSQFGRWRNRFGWVAVEKGGSSDEKCRTKLRAPPSGKPPEYTPSVRMMLTGIEGQYPLLARRTHPRRRQIQGLIRVRVRSPSRGPNRRRRAHKERKRPVPAKSTTARRTSPKTSERTPIASRTRVTVRSRKLSLIYNSSAFGGRASTERAPKAT